jgi:hypothetical protein
MCSSTSQTKFESDKRTVFMTAANARQRDAYNSRIYYYLWSRYKELMTFMRMSIDWSVALEQR